MKKIIMPFPVRHFFSFQISPCPPGPIFLIRLRDWGFNRLYYVRSLYSLSPSITYALTPTCYTTQCQTGHPAYLPSQETDLGHLALVSSPSLPSSPDPFAPCFIFRLCVRIEAIKKGRSSQFWIRLILAWENFIFSYPSYYLRCASGSVKSE